MISMKITLSRPQAQLSPQLVVEALIALPRPAAPVRPVDSPAQLAVFSPPPVVIGEQLVVGQRWSLAGTARFRDNWCSWPSVRDAGDRGVRTRGANQGIPGEGHQVVQNCRRLSTRCTACTSEATHSEIKKISWQSGARPSGTPRGHVSTGLQGRSPPPPPGTVAAEAWQQNRLSQRLTSAERHTASARQLMCAGPSPCPPGSWRQVFTDPAQRAGAAGLGHRAKQRPAGGAST